jgi:hypothetical protein
MSVELARQVLTTEAEAILRLRGRLDAPLEEGPGPLAGGSKGVVFTREGRACRWSWRGRC